METIFDLTGMGLLPARHATPHPAQAPTRHAGGLWHRLGRWFGQFAPGLARARERAADERECWRAYRELARLDDHLLGRYRLHPRRPLGTGARGAQAGWAAGQFLNPAIA